MANDCWERHEEADASYYDLRANVEEFHDEVADARDKSDVVVTNSQATELSFTTHKHVDKGKGIVKVSDDSLPKLVKASRKVCPCPYILVLIDYELPGGKMVKMAYEEACKIIEKEEKIKNAELNKFEIIKVAAEEVKEVEVIIYGGKDFVKHQEELLRVHNEKDPSKITKRKRKTMELEPEEYIACPKGVKFIMNKVETTTLLGYMMMAYADKLTSNQKFMDVSLRFIKASWEHGLGL
nr:hypothetical protein [Tanacetum cinerariifolium]GEW92860.1 hypothetical protein [Tanacetum cinerariifolium]